MLTCQGEWLGADKWLKKIVIPGALQQVMFL